MPLLILVIVAAVVLGMTTSRRIARAVTAVASAMALLAFVWAVLDGKGDDPAWLLVLPVVVGAGAVWLADRLASGRESRLTA